MWNKLIPISPDLDRNIAYHIVDIRNSFYNFHLLNNWNNFMPLLLSRCNLHLFDKFMSNLIQTYVHFVCF